MTPFDKLFTKNVPHILEKIFFSMDHESFETCLNVSKSWNRLLTSESFKAKGKCAFREVMERQTFDAAWTGNTEELRRILSGGMADLTRWESKGSMPPLCAAAHQGHSDMVQLLLDEGADVNVAMTDQGGPNDGMTPLHWAVFYGHRDVVQLLINRGADSGKPDKAGLTPREIARFLANVGVGVHPVLDQTRLDIFNILKNGNA